MTNREGETSGNDIARRLERGELLSYSASPIALPTSEERSYLASQEPAGLAHKNICFDPTRDRLTGYLHRSSDQRSRLRTILAGFSQRTIDWLARLLPFYARHWRLDRVSYCPVEEATRRLRLRARNDLLHVDAFPTRPSNGCRILRVFINLSLTESCVWLTSDTFPRLLQRFAFRAGLPMRGLSLTRVWQQVRDLPRILGRGRNPRSEYDAFMLRLHNVLKENEPFQESSPRRLWTFPPESAWLCMTDTLSHAALRGRHVLDHSFFIAPGSLLLPEESPAEYLARACGFPVLSRAA
jgi:hypothetical protein